jgi:hypothetical protein
VPKNSDDVADIYSILPLSIDRWIFLYGIASITGKGYTDTMRLSIISIDYTNGIYELVGNYYELMVIDVLNSSPIFMFNSTLIVKCGNSTVGFKLYWFKVDTKLWTLELKKSIDLLLPLCYCNLIDGDVVVAVTSRSDNGLFVLVDNFRVINPDYTVTTIDNTGACLPSYVRNYPAKCNVVS